ncbi:hypothetical protein TRVL_04827 [Trypanosoma vivax]|nr:hypothetical protein TRVL_04827 [Trypanosoma vivax]
MAPRRSFVFITNIPEFLLEPLAPGKNGDRPRNNRDPRYERLRSLLATHTPGVMHVIHLETRGYALALYASEEEALAACKTPVEPTQREKKYPPLLLRILQREKPAPVQAVYTPTITVEGEVVLKSELANTRGLELVYRGRAIARWCPNTAAMRDCPFGASCNWIHKRAHQQTMRKRLRVEPVAQPMTQEQEALVRLITQSTRCAEEHFVPPSMKTSFSVYVPVNREESLALVGGSGAKATNTSDLIAAVQKRVEDACAGYSGPFFVKLAIPGGAPWDWSLHDEKVGLMRLQERLSFPENGAPTPLERDLLLQALLYQLNQLNRFETVGEALAALSTSPKVRQSLLKFLDTRGDKERGEEAGALDATPLEVCVRPWLFLPTAGMEASVLFEGGGDILRGIVQRRGSLRLMTSYAFLQRQMDFSRFAVLGSGQDPEAEALLEAEVQQLSLSLRRAAEKIRQFIRHQRLPPGALWCAQLAVSPPPPVAAPSTSCGTENDLGQRVVTPAEELAEPPCFVLSLREYQPALEEHVSLHGELHGSSVTWNTKKHAYIPLVSREVLERLST